MQLLARRIERQFQRSQRRHAFAEDLVIKIEQMKECFTGNTLPLSTAKVIAAWNNLPNDTVDILPMSMKTGIVFLRAPPPTPTGFASDTEDPTSSEWSFSDSDDSGWVFVDNTKMRTPGAVASRAHECSAASDDSMSWYSYPDQCWDRQSVKEDSFQSTDRNSPSSSSDQESPSSGSQISSTPAEFYYMVDQWFLDYCTRGAGPFVESLVACGVVSLGTASLTSGIARAIIKKVIKISYTEGKNLEDAIRFSVLATFRKYWESNNTCSEASPSPYGINIASFVGSLFSASVTTVRDIHLCLSFLLGGERRFDRLCAMHALLAQANDKLCKNRNLPALMQFKLGITCRDGESGEYVWATTPRSQIIITDILARIEQWIASQALKRERSRKSSGNTTIRHRAVGPRLRNGPVPAEPLLL